VKGAAAGCVRTGAGDLDLFRSSFVPDGESVVAVMWRQGEQGRLFLVEWLDSINRIWKRCMG
jgi:hypothetical protein